MTSPAVLPANIDVSKYAGQRSDSTSISLTFSGWKESWMCTLVLFAVRVPANVRSCQSMQRRSICFWSCCELCFNSSPSRSRDALTCTGAAAAQWTEVFWGNRRKRVQFCSWQRLDCATLPAPSDPLCVLAPRTGQTPSDPLCVLAPRTDQTIHSVPCATSLHCWPRFDSALFVFHYSWVPP